MGTFQETGFVNCAGCGKIVEVVSPITNREIYSVTASKSDYIHDSYISNIDGYKTDYACTYIKCPFCRQTLKINWTLKY